jgi:hypothetical protein
MKEMPEHSEDQQAVTRRSLLKSGVVTGLFGIGMFASAEAVERFSSIHEDLVKAQADPESQIPLAGGLSQENLLMRQKAGIESLRLMGTLFTIFGTINVFDAALHGDRQID